MAVDGVSRFSRIEFPSMSGVSDRAGGCGLAILVRILLPSAWLDDVSSLK